MSTVFGLQAGNYVCKEDMDLVAGLAEFCPQAKDVIEGKVCVGMRGFETAI